MLVDDVKESALIKGAIGDAWHGKLCQVLDSAQRFDLSEDFSAAATQISDTNMAAFANALTACRAPAPLCWIEVAQSHRSKFKHDNSHVPMSEDVTRVGILLEQMSDDGLAYKLTLFFRCKSAGAALSMVSLIVDLREVDNEAKRQRRLTGVEAGLVRATLAEKFTGENLDAAFELEQMTCMTGNDYTNDTVQRMIKDHGEAFVREAVAADQQNWDGELMYWLSAFALLNTRNVGKTVPVDVSKVNKGRSKKGKPPLMSYETCCIDQSRLAGESHSDNDNGIRNGTRAHFVRGHFKMRKTGVFWWRPAVRGKASLGMKMKTYHVRHTTPAAKAA